VLKLKLNSPIVHITFVLRVATSLGFMMDARVMFEPRSSGPLTVIDCILLSLLLLDDYKSKLEGFNRQ
jgi:hypothetical protein